MMEPTVAPWFFVGIVVAGVLIAGVQWWRERRG